MTQSAAEYKGAIAICTPMYGDVAYRSYVNSVLLLADVLRVNGYAMTLYAVGEESLITRARNTLIHQALTTKDLVGVLFLDADQGVDPNDVLSLIESGKDIIGGIVPKKELNWAQVKNAVLMNMEDLAQYSGHYAVNFLDNKSIEVTYNDPIEVKHIGTGLMYVSASVFEKLKPICKTYKTSEIGAESVEQEVVEFFTTSISKDTQKLLGEDHNFCEMWKSLGGSIWAAPWVKVTHSGSYTYRGSFIHTVDMISRLNEIASTGKLD